MNSYDCICMGMHIIRKKQMYTQRHAAAVVCNEAALYVVAATLLVGSFILREDAYYS